MLPSSPPGTTVKLGMLSTAAFTAASAGPVATPVTSTTPPVKAGYFTGTRGLPPPRWRPKVPLLPCIGAEGSRVMRPRYTRSDTLQGLEQGTPPLGVTAALRAARTALPCSGVRWAMLLATAVPSWASCCTTKSTNLPTCRGPHPATLSAAENGTLLLAPSLKSAFSGVMLPEGTNGSGASAAGPRLGLRDTNSTTPQVCPGAGPGVAAAGGAAPASPAGPQSPVLPQAPSSPRPELAAGVTGASCTPLASTDPSRALRLRKQEQGTRPPSACSRLVTVSLETVEERSPRRDTSHSGTCSVCDAGKRPGARGPNGCVSHAAAMVAAPASCTSPVTAPRPGTQGCTAVPVGGGGDARQPLGTDTVVLPGCVSTTRPYAADTAATRHWLA